MASNIFFDGTIQAAIAFATQHNCPLACFVTDDGEESTKWRNSYFRSPEAIPLLSRCVLIRIEAGSVEAGFLAAFCPIQAVPYFTVIKDGALKANIMAGATEAGFLEQFKSAFEAEPQAISEPEASSELEVTPQRRVLASIPDPAPPSPPPVLPSPVPAPSATSEPPEAVGRTNNLKYLQQQQKRRQEAEEERQRILRLLELDRRERKEREPTKKSLPEVEDTQIVRPPGNREPSEMPARPRPSDQTAISFRLLDGLSLKSRFPSSSVLGTHVRKWVDENRSDGDHPYNFLQILAPLPNKHLSISDENSTLSDLGLSPSCTLVLVPTSSYTSAYGGGNEIGLLSRIYGTVYNSVIALLGVGFPTTPFVPQEPVQPPSRAGTPGLRVRTLHDVRQDGSPDGSQDRNYYNGNQLDFEPNPDDDEHSSDDD